MLGKMSPFQLDGRNGQFCYNACNVWFYTNFHFGNFPTFLALHSLDSLLQVHVVLAEDVPLNFGVHQASLNLVMASVKELVMPQLHCTSKLCLEVTPLSLDK